MFVAFPFVENSDIVLVGGCFFTIHVASLAETQDPLDYRSYHGSCTTCEIVRRTEHSLNLKCMPLFQLDHVIFYDFLPLLACKFGKYLLSSERL